MEELIPFISQSDKLFNDFFKPLFDSMYSFGRGFIALGLFLFFMFNVAVRYIQGNGNFGLEKLYPYLVLIVMYSNLGDVIKTVDNIVKLPGRSALTTLGTVSQTEFTKLTSKEWSLKQNDEVKRIIKEEEKKRADALSNKTTLEKLDAAVGNFGTALATNLTTAAINLILFLINFILSIALICAVLLMVVSSNMASNLMIALLPLAFGLQFLPFFSGTLTGWLKNFIAFRMWATVSAYFAIGMFNSGLMNKVISNLDNSLMSLSAITSGVVMPFKIDIVTPILLIIYIYTLKLVPSVIDKALNTSSGGAAGGMMGAAALAGGTVAAGKAATMSTGGKIISIAAGGAKNIASQLGNDAKNIRTEIGDSFNTLKGNKKDPPSTK